MLTNIIVSLKYHLWAIPGILSESEEEHTEAGIFQDGAMLG